jgi:hypothetical protein
VTVTDPPPFKFDEVNVWSEIKLEIVEKYGAAYTGAFSRHPRLKKSMSMLSAALALTSRKVAEVRSTAVLLAP